MGKLLRPLISEIAHRPGISKYKDNLLQKFVPHTLTGTPLAGSQLQKALENELKQQRYSVALNTLKGQERDLDTSSYLPKSEADSDSFVHQDSGIMQKATRKMFYQFTRTLDKLMQKRLLTISHFSSSFLSSVVEQLRLTLQAEHRNQSQIESHLEVEINKVQASLDQQCHQPELSGVYIALAAVLGFNFLTLLCLYLLHNSIVSWFLRQQVKNGRQHSVPAEVCSLLSLILQHTSAYLSILQHAKHKLLLRFKTQKIPTLPP